MVDLEFLEDDLVEAFKEIHNDRAAMEKYIRGELAKIKDPKERAKKAAEIKAFHEREMAKKRAGHLAMAEDAELDKFLI